MKNSYINQVPDEWKIKKFTELIDKKRIRIGKIKKNNYLSEGKYPIIDQGQDFIAGYTNTKALVYDGKLPVIIFGDHTRIFKYVIFPFVAGADGTQIIRPNIQLIIPKYFYYALLNTPIISRGYSRHYSLLKMKEILVPPLVEQSGIVEVLGTVDECIRLTEEVIGRAEELKRGLMQRLLTRGIGHTEYKQTSLGEIPKTWDTIKYEQANERIFVGIATSSTQHMSDQGIPLIRNQNIKEGMIDLTDLVYITKRFSEANKSKMIKENDILTVRTGYTGQSCKVEKEMEGWQTFTTIISRPNLREFDPDFIVNFLNSPLARNQILSLEAGLAQKNLNVRWISNLIIPKPPLLEQQKISQMIKKIYDYRETVISEKNHLMLIKQGLMQLLLSGEVRVELRENGLHRIGNS